MEVEMKIIQTMFSLAVVLVLVTACAPAAQPSSNSGSGAPELTTPQSGSGDVFQGSATIEISNFAFSPRTATVKVGTEVTWINLDSTSHNVTADDNSFASGQLGNNDTFKFTFTTPGTYNYSCTTHPSMKATIIVVQ